MLKSLTSFQETSLYFLKWKKLLRSRALFYIFVNLPNDQLRRQLGPTSTSAFYLLDITCHIENSTIHLWENKRKKQTRPYYDKNGFDFADPKGSQGLPKTPRPHLENRCRTRHSIPKAPSLSYQFCEPKNTCLFFPWKQLELDFCYLQLKAFWVIHNEMLHGSRESLGKLRAVSLIVLNLSTGFLLPFFSNLEELPLS